MPNRRSADFKYYAATNISFGVSTDAVRILFTIEEGPGDFLDQAGAIVSFANLRLLQILTEETFSMLKERRGIDIKMDAESEAALRKAFRDTFPPVSASGDERPS
jgi:hypothetical protein